MFRNANAHENSATWIRARKMYVFLYVWLSYLFKPSPGTCAVSFLYISIKEKIDLIYCSMQCCQKWGGIQLPQNKRNTSNWQLCGWLTCQRGLDGPGIFLFVGGLRCTASLVDQSLTYCGVCRLTSHVLARAVLIVCWLQWRRRRERPRHTGVWTRPCDSLHTVRDRPTILNK